MQDSFDLYLGSQPAGPDAASSSSSDGLASSLASPPSDESSGAAERPDWASVLRVDIHSIQKAGATEFNSAGDADI